ncbi:MAG TPA: SMP-30/gluconolactonase/LRE family protein [Steroidobacteraceae bacterium]|nr:SMP-30/gluconolactonase/LRE family protein [Steroidobacteraceae bacterium]
MRLGDFRLAAADFGTLGHGLHRPECVWVDVDGIWVSDARGGVSRLTGDGAPRLLGSGILEPNGFSRRPDGSFVVAGIGDGELHLVLPTGATRTLVDRFQGKPLGAVNYACAEGSERIWLSVMTRGLPWHTAFSARHVDGYILRIDGQEARSEIVADGLDLTNEVKLSPDGRHLYAVETFGSRVVRFAIRRDGSLGAKERVGPDSLGPDVMPDGITFDVFGNLWITVINQNGLMVIDRHHDAHVVYRDPNPQAVAQVTEAVAQRNGVVEQLAACADVSGPLRLPTSVAFGGPDGLTGYVGSVGMSHLATFRLPADLV